MTLKFTKCGVGAESGDETLLFEFLDQECPELIEMEWVSELVNHKFIGSLQTQQHQGIFLSPITFNFKFHGAYVDINNNVIMAKNRFDQLARLQGRVIKFWYEGIKQLVIIQSLKVQFHNYQKVYGSITLAPHDLQVAIKPTQAQAFLATSNKDANTDVKKNDNLVKVPIGIELTVKAQKNIIKKEQKEYAENKLTQDGRITNLEKKLKRQQGDLATYEEEYSKNSPAFTSNEMRAEMYEKVQNTKAGIKKTEQLIKMEKAIKVFK